LPGLVPGEIDLDTCNACGLCMDACPEPYGLMPRPADATDLELEDPHRLL
jgi:NAD-dependent dihydropyrimidine dehydrogenase PreA subunit